MLNSIFTPAHLKRNWRKKLSDSDQSYYDLGNLGQYDDSTLVYDVFLEPDNQTVTAITPPLLNLKKTTLPMYLIVGEEKYIFTQVLADRKVEVYQLKLNMPLLKTQSFQLVTPIKGYIIELYVDIEKLDGPALVTLQKNNSIQWVEDWVDFYKQKFDIQHIYIYDNNSSNVEELRAALRGKATVISWNFPYGPYRQLENSFAQMGALNHFRFKYGEHCTIFNFDIDELLFYKNETIRNEILRSSYAQFDSFQGSPISQVTPDDYSFKDFLYREKVSRDCAYKYVAKGKLGYLRVHKFTFFKNKFSSFKPVTLVFNNLYKVLLNKLRKPKVFSTEDAYFIHYTPITTNWKECERTKVKELDLSVFKLDVLAESFFTENTKR